jgi:murein DD-endopeptidase MepM/ murein hydrolase activator NlpD
LKRTFPQKAKPVPACAVDGRITTEQVKPSQPEVHRRARTSAAMIGLAISMGAHALLLPRQSDSAMAAEPVAPEASITATPTAFETAVLSSEGEVEQATVGVTASSSVVEHTVQEGQTLWQLAQIYQINPAIIAATNGVSLDAVLHVGQTLSIPTASQVVSAEAGAGVEVVSPSSTVSGSSTDAVSTSPEVALTLKQEQEASLERLRQKRDVLKGSLAELRSTAEPTQEPIQLGASSSDAAVKQAKSMQPDSPVADLPQVAYQPSAKTISPNLPLPAQAQPEVKRAEVAGYRVKRGDTINSIARKHGTSVAELVKLNRLSNPNFILVNQMLKVPQGGTEQATSVIPGLSASNAPITVASSTQNIPVAPGLSLNEPSASSLDVQLGNSSNQPEFKGGVAAVPTALAANVPSLPENSQEVSEVALNSSSNKVVAVFPANSSPSPVNVDSSELRQSRYISNLRTEISKLREKYEAEEVNRQLAPSGDATVAGATEAKPVLPATARQVNPEFASARGTSTPKPGFRESRQIQPTGGQSSTQTETQRNSELVAVAPLGSEAYEPIIQSALGQMVSPDLPPIGVADAYLPEGAPEFKGYIWPAKGVLTSGYGWRWGRMHRGIDIAAPIGTPVVASAAGVVVTAGWNSGGYGNLVEIRHPDGSLTLYAHNNRILVREGQQVAQGQQIAEMGSTGYSTGPHSHFEVHLPGRGAVNPLAHLPRSRGNS